MGLRQNMKAQLNRVKTVFPNSDCSIEYKQSAWQDYGFQVYQSEGPHHFANGNSPREAVDKLIKANA